MCKVSQHSYDTKSQDKKTIRFSLVNAVRHFLTLCLLFVLVFPLHNVQANPVITNTATANFTINGTNSVLFDSVQFTKDTVVQPPDTINISKQANKSVASIGHEIQYSLVITNPNSSILTNVRVEDILPGGLVYKTNSARLNNSTVNSSLINISGNTLTIQLGSLAAGQSSTLTYIVQVSSSTPIGNAINRATAISDTATSTQTTAQVTINRPIIQIRPLDLTKAVNTTAARIGEVIRFTISLSNPNSTGMSGVKITDNLPTGLEFILDSATLNGTPINPLIASNNLTFDIGHIGSTSNLKLNYDTRVISPGINNQLTNNAFATTSNANANSNSDSVTVSILEDNIVLNKTVNKTTASVGETLEYTVSVSNPLENIVNNLVVTDTLPSHFILQPDSVKINQQKTDGYNLSGNILKINLDTLGALEIVSITYKVTIGESASPGETINSVIANTAFSNSNTATASVRVRTPSIINFLKINDDGNLSIIQPTSYNSSAIGNTNFEKINVIGLPNGNNINLPSPQPLINATEYSTSEPIVIEVIDLDQNLSPETLETIIVTVSVPGTNDKEILLLTETSPNSGIFRGIIPTNTDSTETYDGELTIADQVKINVTYVDQEDSTDTSATAALIVPNITLTLSKIADKNSASIGEIVKYNLEFKNTTGLNLSNPVIEDLLPVGFRYLQKGTKLNGNELSSGITVSGRKVSFRLPEMQNNASWTVEYLAKITAGVKIGKAINSATFSSGDYVSNTARASVLVKDELMRSKNILTGRVYIGCKKPSKDNTSSVLKDARIYMETGRSVLSDEEGFWHMEGVQPGAHVLQLDTESIEGYQPILCENNTRKAQDAKSTFVNLKPGTLWNIDFHVKPIEGFVKKGTNEKIEKKSLNPLEIFNKNYLKTAPEGFEILWPKNNFVPAISSTKIFVKSSPKHSVDVILNGKKVSPLNYDGSDTNKSQSVIIRRWVGVDLNIKNKSNTLLVILKDKSGKEISRKTHNIHISGQPHSAELLTDQSILIADGKTVPVIALKIKDADGFPMRANTHGYFSLENSRYQVRTSGHNKAEALDINESLAGDYKYSIEEGGIARIKLNPTTQSGEVKLNIKFGEENSSQKAISAWLKPKLRDWIMVGIAEGTLAHKNLSGNMQTLKDLDKSDEFYKRGRFAFFAKGIIKGKYLLTLAYDTHKPEQEVGSQLSGNIDPDAWYTVYADNSKSQYDAPSSRKLYLKLEKDNFYTLFGDYHSGMTITQLAKYERVLNGIKTEYQSERYSFNGFISETSNQHQREEIPGDGTSGLYRLSQNIIPNSETIKIETRDRFQSDRILESRQLIRYQDYNIDYDAGTLFFKFPIPGRDQNFNPNLIIADYDTEEDTNKSISAGGRVAVKGLNGKLEAGLSAIHEGRNNAKDNQLLATDISYQINPKTKISAEAAISKSEENNHDEKQAYIIELESEIKKAEARLYVKRTEDGFGIDSQAVGNGTQKAGAELKYKISKNTKINSEISYQDNLENDNKRKVAEVLVDHQIKQVNLRAGFRRTEETISEDDEQKDINNNTLLLGGSYTTKNDKVTFRGDLEKNINSNDGSEISPDRAILGVDVKLKQGLSVFAEHETTDNGETKTHNNRVGVSKSLWKGATGKSTYTQERTNEGQRNYATLGLSQKIKLNDKISADFSVDQAKTLSSNIDQKTFNQEDPSVQGSQRDDYTAFSVGLGSKNEDWSWTTRTEYRNGDIEDKTNFVAGLIRHYSNGKNLSAKLSYYNSDLSNGDFEENIKLSFGTAWHPKEKDFVFLSRLDLIHQDEMVLNDDESNTLESSTDSNTNKIVHNMHYYRKLNSKSEISIHHGIKYVEDSHSGVTNITTIDTGTIEYRKDISKKVDIGIHGGYLHDWKSKTVESVAGVSIGVTPVKNAWAELGYNFEGFDDEDFDDSNFKRKGPYVDFRYKFNQDILNGDLPIRRKGKETKDTSLKPEGKVN